jgi:hypothetical protein
VPSDEVDPGSDVRVQVTLKPYGKPEEMRVVTVRIPEDAAGAQLELRMEPGDKVPLPARIPGSLRDMVENVKNELPATSLVTSVKVPSQGLRFRGQVVENLPGSALAALQPQNDTRRGVTFTTYDRTHPGPRHRGAGVRRSQTQSSRRSPGEMTRMLSFRSCLCVAAHRRGGRSFPRTALAGSNRVLRHRRVGRFQQGRARRHRGPVQRLGHRERGQGAGRPRRRHRRVVLRPQRQRLVRGHWQQRSHPESRRHEGHDLRGDQAAPRLRHGRGSGRHALRGHPPRGPHLPEWTAPAR